MRIISGEKRGMVILSPKTSGTRPITDRIKESVFNVLQKYGEFEGKRVADVFSGTGSMGLEALSRGAGHVIFVESDYRVIEILNKNIEKGNWKNRSKVIKGNAFKIGAPSFEDGGFDFVFVDPPYVLSRDTGLNSNLGQLLTKLDGQIVQSGVVIVRTEREVKLLENYGGLKIVDRRDWGSMAICILRHAEFENGSEGTGN